MIPRFTVEARADRFQRRYSGPWRTAEHEIGLLVITHRYRRRTRIEGVRLAVAGHDLWTHVLWRETLLPAVLPVVKWLARVLR